MKLTTKMIIAFLITINSSFIYAKGGDDSGNGGFAYKQSDKILKMATAALQETIPNSTLGVLVKNPNWRGILFTTLKYENLQKLHKKNARRGDKLLAMDYVVNPPSVKILKPYYVAFMGKTDGELEASSLEVQKRLLHEASHIWGYNEPDSEKFAQQYLENVGLSAKRATNDISFKSDSCSCLNGKSDSIYDCNDFCANKPITSKPTLYLSAILGSEVLKNPKIKNIYDWCTILLDSDQTAPQCSLIAWDGTDTIEIPVKIAKSKNDVMVDITPLKTNKTYIIKIVETKAGSDAFTKEVQIKRVDQKKPEPDLKVIRKTPISQYTCLDYEGEIDSNGNIYKTAFTRSYYYFPREETPAPIPSSLAGQPSPTVCHDDELHPGNDSVLYPRLELTNSIFTLWQKEDFAFYLDGKDLKIHQRINKRLDEEYNIPTFNTKIFFPFNYFSGPGNTPNIQGYVLVPFVDPHSGRSMCPTESDLNYSNEPLFNILRNYIGETEGLYIASGEVQVIGHKTTYSTMLISESNLKDIAFTISAGIKEQTNDWHRGRIYFYWPRIPGMDPLEQAERKLFTIKSLYEIPELSQNNPMGENGMGMTTDSRIACIPKSLSSPTTTNGGKSTGATCSTDFECSSFCCDQTYGACKPHDGKNLFCEKSQGQFCVTDNFCFKESVTECRVYKTGMAKPDGSPVCALRCQPEEKFGSCVNNMCLPVKLNAMPTQDDIDTCKGAI